VQRAALWLSGDWPERWPALAACHAVSAALNWPASGFTTEHLKSKRGETPVRCAQRLASAAATSGVVTVALVLGFHPAQAQQACGGTPPFTCEDMLTGGAFEIEFELPTESDLIAFTSNFDPDHPVDNAIDPLLELFNALDTPIASNDEGGSDFSIENANTLFSHEFDGEIFSAGNVWDAILDYNSPPAIHLDAGTYRLDVSEVVDLGANFRVHVFTVTPDGSDQGPQ
jgi:hypothetical protein